MAKSGAETQKERRAAGKCCSCSEAATHGVRCERHWLAKKEQDQQRYLQRKASGLCGMCGKNPKPPDKECCHECREKQNADRRVPPEQKHVPYDKPFHQRNKEAGYCSTGGATHLRPESGHGQCQLCLAKKRERNNRIEERQKHNTRKRTKYQEKQISRLCVEDGCSAPATHGKKCEEHCLAARVKCQKQYATLHEQAVDAYGGYKCNCPDCRCITPEFLQFHHVNNDGAAHRRSINGKNQGSKVVLRDLKKRNWPQGVIALICASCHAGITRIGCCPLA